MNPKPKKLGEKTSAINKESKSSLSF
jgi:hypothetical protein